MTDLSTYWKNLPDTSTPVEASVLNGWGADLETVRDEAVAARDAAQAAAEAAGAPADDQVATLIASESSATRGQLDAAFTPYQAGRDAAWVGFWGELSTDPAAAAANTALIQQALTEANVVRLPAGKFYIDSTISISGRQKIYGAGSEATTLTSTNPTLTTIAFTNGPGASVRGLTITKEVPPTNASSYGIDFGNTSGGATLDDLRVRKHGVGIRLGGTSLSNLSNTVVEWNFSHGVFMSNAVSTVNSLQWYLLNVLSQGNGGDGFRAQSTAGKGVCSFGKLVQCYTYSNNGRGVIVSAPAQADRIAAVRISDSFFGQDGNDELYLGTFSGTHQITNTYFELAGTTTTGPGKFTGSGWDIDPVAASLQGSGIVVSADNEAVLIQGCYLVQNSRNGITTSGTQVVMTGNHFDSNGFAQQANLQNGLHVTAGSAQVVGNFSGNINGSTQQQYGFLFGVTNVLFDGNMTGGNRTAATSGSTPATSGTNRLV